MSVPLIAEIVPKNNGQFALLDDSYVRGGFRICQTLTERNNISNDKRKQGMIVYVISTDIAYSLNADLVSWTVNTALTQSLQAAYNGGAHIVTSANDPVVIQGSDLTSMIFQIVGMNGDILDIGADGLVEVKNTFKSNEYTTSIESVTPANSPNIVIDSTDATEYRAIQYFYTCSNSDGSGFETGQVYLVHNGIKVSVCAMISSTIGISCGLSFDANIAGNTMNVLVTTDNSGAFSRVLRLFKVALR